MKRGSVARLGRPGEMLTGTESCQMHTPKGAIKTDLQLHTLLPPTLLQRVINFNRNVFLDFFSTFCHFFWCMQGQEFHSVSFFWNVPIIYNLLCIFVFSFAPYANIIPSAVPIHLFFLPFSAHLSNPFSNAL